MPRFCLSLLPAALCIASTATGGINQDALGASYDATAGRVAFRVYSATATQIELDLYTAAAGSDEALRITLQADPVTHIFSADVPLTTLQTAGIAGPVSAPLYYGYRAWGPNWPVAGNWTRGSAAGFVADVDAMGNRFNPNKLLIDPYAREISHDPTNASWTDGTIYASGAANRNRDSGRAAPKSLLWQPAAALTGTKPVRAQKDDVLYEVNVRGLTENDSSVPLALRGTYAGAALKAKYLADLGVTAVELQPVQETQNDANDNVPGSTTGQDYWGYSTLNYFSPDRRYASDKSAGGPTREFQSLVKAFHDQGLKIYLDVVYNHTGEGYAWNSADTSTYNIISWRGLDNATYYELTADSQYSYDNTGTGGNFNTYNTVAQNLIIDSLAYWRDVMGVDGFRFDLAPLLGNSCTVDCFHFDATDPNVAINRILRELPPRPASGGAGIDLYAEPWAAKGDGAYQLGNFPAGWSEWNGQFRDSMRQAQNDLGVNPITTGQLATRLAGSSDLFSSRNPWNSTNFMAVHDGFTLSDIYACNGPNNAQPWPYGPSDGGSSDNYSWDQGSAAADQRAAARVGLAFEMLSAGTPLLEGGDELLRSLRCNNNAYNVDSTGNWLNYVASTDQRNFQAFVRGLIAFRKAHSALRPQHFYTSTQLEWWTPAATAADTAYFENAANHAVAYQLNGALLSDGSPAIYVAYNGWSGGVNFILPSPGTHRKWYRVTDTCSWAEGPKQVRTPGSEDLLGAAGFRYSLCARGLLLLIAR